MRAKIQLWLLCLLLAWSYATKVPGLLGQGSVGILPLVVGGLFSLGLIVLLWRRSTGAALVIGVLASASVVLQAIGYFLAPALLGTEPPAPQQLAVALGSTLVGAFLALDLWSQWRKAARQAAAVAGVADPRAGGATTPQAGGETTRTP